MKKNLFLLLLMLCNVSLFAQTINISTGIDNAGNPLPVSAPDPNWVITSFPGPGIVETAHYLWIPQPITGTNAQWLNNTGNLYGAVTGIQIFERSFTVAPGVPTVNCNFSISYDDNLLSLELVRPDNSIFPIPNTVPSPYYFLSPLITASIPTNSLSGTFKIRAKVDFVDAVGGWLLSGSVSMQGSKCNVLYDDFSNPTLWSHPLTPYTCSTDYNDIGISSGTFNFMQANDNHINYMYRGGLAITNSNFKASIEFTPTAFGSNQGVGHRLLALTSGSKSFGWDHTSTCYGGSTLPCSYPGILPCNPSNQAGIEVMYLSSSPFGGTYDFLVRVNVGDGITFPYTIATLPSTNLAGTGTYYLQLERTSLTSGTLSVFTNPAMTIHATGSPVSFSTLPPSLIGLNTVSIGVDEGGYYPRELTAQMDNLCISSSPCNLTVTTTGSGCGTAACPYVCVGTPSGGVFSGPSGLNPVTGVYIGAIPVAGLPYTYTYTASNGCIYNVTGTITKPTTSNPPLPPAGLATYVGPSAAGAQLVVTWPCTGYTCGEWYEFKITQNGNPVPGCTTVYSVAAPSNTLPFGYTPLPAGTCAKVLSCPGLAFGAIYEVSMRVNRCGVYGPYSAPFSTPPQRLAGSAPSHYEEVKVFPNPMNESLHIVFPSDEAMHADLVLYDLSGRIVKQEALEMLVGSNEFNVNTQSLASGMYVLKVLNNDNLLYTTRVIKQD